MAHDCVLFTWVDFIVDSRCRKIQAKRALVVHMSYSANTTLT